jgi:hypothetical protein
MSTTDKYVSPVIDELHTGTVLVKNIIDNGPIESKNVVLISGGTNYGPTVSIGGVGSAATGWVEVLNGVIVNGYIQNAGTSYGANLTNIPVTVTANGFGSGAAMTAVSNATGNIIGFNITNGGSDYGPLITVSGSNMMGGDTCFLGCKVGGSTLAQKGVVTAINILDSGFGYYKSPTVTVTNTGGSGSGLSIQINLEDKKSGGNCKARYITKQVQLNFDSTSLKAFMEVNRPAETEIKVFAKFLNRDDPTNIRETAWQEMSLKDIILIPVASNPTSFNEISLELNNINYNKNIDGSPNNFIGFNAFKVKVCMYSKSTSIVPRIKNFRAVAVK